MISTRPGISPRVAVLGISLLLTACDLFVGTREHLDRADKLLATGDYGQAAIEIRNALADSPKDPRAQLLLARVSVQLGNLEGAESALDAAIGAPKGEIAALRADLRLRRGQFDQLLTELDRHALDVPESDARLLRIRALGGLNRCDDALKLVRAGTSDKPGGVISVVVAECYARGGDVARAARELQAATVARPDDATAWMALGRLQQLSGENAAAESSWLNASRHAGGQLSVPQQAMMFASLADLQLARGDLPAARITHENLVKIAPQATLTDLLDARLKLMSGQDDAALGALRQLATRAPELPAIRTLLASVYLRQGSLEQARQQIAWLDQHNGGQLQGALARSGELAGLSRDSEDYWLRVADLQNALGQPDAARAALVEAQRVAPASPRPAMALAEADLRAGNVEAAMRAIEPLAANRMSDDAVQLIHAQTLMAVKHYAEAANVFARVQQHAPSRSGAIAEFRARKLGSVDQPVTPLRDWLEKHPDDVVVRALYAEELRLADQRPAAIAEYEAVVRAAPDNSLALNNLAWLYHLQNDSRALPMAKRAWQRSPKVPAIADTYGWLLVESGALRDGLTVLKDADAAGGFGHPDIRMHYAVALSRAGRRDEAIDLLRGLVDDGNAGNQQEAARLLKSLQESGAT